MLYHVVSAFSIVVYWRIIRQKYFHNTITLLNNPSYITLMPKWLYRLSKTYYVIFHSIQHSGGHHSLHNSCQPYNIAAESPLPTAGSSAGAPGTQLWTLYLVIYLLRCSAAHSVTASGIVISKCDIDVCWYLQYLLLPALLKALSHIRSQLLWHY